MEREIEREYREGGMTCKQALNASNATLSAPEALDMLNG